MWHCDDSNTKWLDGTVCKDHSTCPPGQGLQTLGTNDADTVCEDCANSFNGADDLSSCQSWSTCSSGQGVQSAPTPSADTVCVPCNSVADNTYSTFNNVDDSSTACQDKTHLHCPVGYGLYKNGDSATVDDWTCNACDGAIEYNNDPESQQNANHIVFGVLVNNQTKVRAKNWAVQGDIV